MVGARPLYHTRVLTDYVMMHIPSLNCFHKITDLLHIRVLLGAL